MFTSRAPLRTSRLLLGADTPESHASFSLIPSKVLGYQHEETEHMYFGAKNPKNVRKVGVLASACWLKETGVLQAWYFSSINLFSGVTVAGDNGDIKTQADSKQQFNGFLIRSNPENTEVMFGKIYVAGEYRAISPVV